MFAARTKFDQITNSTPGIHFVVNLIIIIQYRGTCMNQSSSNVADDVFSYIMNPDQNTLMTLKAIINNLGIKYAN